MRKDLFMILRKAKQAELPLLWDIVQYAIEQRRLDGSQQWQNSYPNENSLQTDLDNGHAYVVEENGTVLVYAALIFDIEPAYTAIQGKWLTDGEYVVLHRVAASPLARGKRAATKLFELVEGLCKERNVHSIKVDTNYDNAPMLRIMDKLGYTYCGEVFFNGSARRAFEKVLP